MLIIDTHAHIYSLDEKRYPPIEKPLRPPGGKASVEDLQRQSRANGVKAVCAIQTSTFYRFDNRYICDSARAHPDWIAGVLRSIRTTRTVRVCYSNLFVITAFAACGAFRPGMDSSITRESEHCGRQVWSRAS